VFPGSLFSFFVVGVLLFGWLHQSFELSTVPGAELVFVQHENGPCGVLSAALAELIVHLGFKHQPEGGGAAVLASSAWFACLLVFLSHCVVEVSWSGLLCAVSSPRVVAVSRSVIEAPSMDDCAEALAWALTRYEWTAPPKHTHRSRNIERPACVVVVVAAAAAAAVVAR